MDNSNIGNQLSPKFFLYLLAVLSAGFGAIFLFVTYFADAFEGGISTTEFIALYVVLVMGWLWTRYVQIRPRMETIADVKEKGMSAVPVALRDAHSEDDGIMRWGLDRLSRTGDMAQFDLSALRFQGRDLGGVTIWVAKLDDFDFDEVVLNKASLSHSSAQRARFVAASIEDAVLIKNDLQDAIFTNARMDGVILAESDLRNARMQGAHLRYADFSEANVAGTNFRGAILDHAQFAAAQFSTETILPDGAFWTPDTDLTRFTDPQHPAYFRPRIPSDRLVDAETEDNDHATDAAQSSTDQAQP